MLSVVALSNQAAALRAAPPMMMAKEKFPWELSNQFDAASAAANNLDAPWGDSTEVSDVAGLKELAIKLNPVIGFWDPLNLFEDNEESGKELIAWYRHAEIKHGRVAMAGFVGFLVQSQGICFPWNLQGPLGGMDYPTISFADISAAGGPGDQWDALPTSAKIQVHPRPIYFIRKPIPRSTATRLDFLHCPSC